MACVQDQVTCPKCGFKEAEVEFNTRGGSETTFCERCGYHAYTDGFIQEESGGFGAYRITYQQVVSLGNFKRRRPLHRRARLLSSRLNKPRVLAASITVKSRAGWLSVPLKIDRLGESQSLENENVGAQ